MATLIATKRPPKWRCWKVTVDSRNHKEPLDEVLQWAKSSCRGRVYWTAVRFRAHGAGHIAPSMQRKFKDGYLVLTVWFHRKGDAALFKLWWG